MNKKFFAIIGKPLSHSLSPALHNFWLKENKIDGVYDFFEIDENEIASSVTSKLVDKKPFEEVFINKEEWKFKSASSDKEYTVKKGKNGYYCDCWGYIGHKKCKHVKEVSESQ